MAEAGVSEGILTHHMGHGPERSRGASKLRGWPDAEWKLLVEKDGDGNPPPGARRYFWAYGRDVDVAESELGFDKVTRHLTMASDPFDAEGKPRNRKSAMQDRKRTTILEFIQKNPGCLAGDLGTLPEYHHSRDKALIQNLVQNGLVHVIKKGQAQHHYPGPAPDGDPTERGEES